MTMRIQLLSDLHFEFHSDNGRSFVESLDPEGVDVLVLAGDIAVGEDLPDALGLLCQRFRDATVIYVHGNHEFYRSSLERVRQLTRKARDENRNLTWLDTSGTTVGGISFWGTPLWFPHLVTEPSLKRLLNDFAEIEDFESWVYRENQEAVGFLLDHVLPLDIVITHHLPSQLCVSPRHRGDALNPFFVCDMTDFIVRRQPGLWLHGHIHDSGDIKIGKTRLVCNPFGYAGHNPNPAFNDRFIIEA
jgi:Icc-related predicted phosphoesterase